MSLGWFIFMLVLVCGVLVGAVIVWKKKNSKINTTLKIVQELVKVTDKFLDFIDSEPAKDNFLEIGVDVVHRGLNFFVELIENGELEGKTVSEIVDYVVLHVKEEVDEYLRTQNIVLDENQESAVDMALKIVGFFVKLFYTEK